MKRVWKRVDVCTKRARNVQQTCREGVWNVYGGIRMVRSIASAFITLSVPAAGRAKRLQMSPRGCVWLFAGGREILTAHSRSGALFFTRPSTTGWGNVSVARLGLQGKYVRK